ncbi:hypothetical protein [Belliella pelovolcani]|nr:hypothetical protein [Belliella pelovolcani]
MKDKSVIKMVLGGFLIGGLGYWFQPYNDLYILGINIYLIIGVGAFLASLFMSLYKKRKPIKIASFVTIGIILAVVCRIVYDITFWDGTSHNLAPFELVICGLIAFIPAIIGGFLGKFTGNMFNPKTSFLQRKK